MGGSFLDTTVVVHIADGIEPKKSLGEKFVAANAPAEMPVYALKELLAGRLRILCEAHNKLKAAENVGEALLALLSVSPAEGRKKEARLHDLADALQEAFAANPTGSRGDDLKREMLEGLAIRATRMWAKARNLGGITTVQPLGCFNSGKLSYGSAGELRGPHDSFNCMKNERCAAAAYIFDNKNDLVKMINALHPGQLDAKLANKNETQQRRKALKELHSKGPQEFDKGRCRALGDAYFAAMCPPGSVVATSNIEDYVPLCTALGKEAKEP